MRTAIAWASGGSKRRARPGALRRLTLDGNPGCGRGFRRGLRGMEEGKMGKLTLSDEDREILDRLVNDTDNGKKDKYQL